MASYANLCRACGFDFSSARLFDFHRIGRHEYTFLQGMKLDPPREDGRRCLDIEEMQARGWTKDEKGRWVDPARVQDARERLAA